MSASSHNWLLAKGRRLLQMLWTTWGQNHRPSPLLPRSRGKPCIACPASTGSIEAPPYRAPSHWRLWKRTDRISTGWRRRPVRNPTSGLIRNLEAMLLPYEDGHWDGG